MVNPARDLGLAPNRAPESSFKIMIVTIFILTLTKNNDQPDM